MHETDFRIQDDVLADMAIDRFRGGGDPFIVAAQLNVTVEQVLQAARDALNTCMRLHSRPNAGRPTADAINIKPKSLAKRDQRARKAKNTEE